MNDINLELYKLYYEKLRDELISHQNGRDQATRMFLIVLAAAAGLFFSSQPTDEPPSTPPDYLVVVPIVAFGTATIWAYHHIIMGWIGEYFRQARRQLSACYEQENAPIISEWDNSPVHNKLGVLLNLRTVGDGLIFLVPPIVCSTYFLSGVIQLVGIVASVATGLVWGGAWYARFTSR